MPSRVQVVLGAKGCYTRCQPLVSFVVSMLFSGVLPLLLLYPRNNLMTAKEMRLI